MAVIGLRDRASDRRASKVVIHSMYTVMHFVICILMQHHPKLCNSADLSQNRKVFD